MTAIVHLQWFHKTLTSKCCRLSTTSNVPAQSPAVTSCMNAKSNSLVDEIYINLYIYLFTRKRLSNQKAIKEIQNLHKNQLKQTKYRREEVETSLNY